MTDFQIPERPVIQRRDGYRMVWRPDHPNAHDGRVYEHRLVAEAIVGRPLRTDEIVHHVNGDRADNRVENLRVVSKRWHQQHHLGTGPNDREAEQLILAGCKGQSLLRLGVWEHRQARIRRKLRLEGRLKDGRCMYCSAPTNGRASGTCLAHSDLPRVDPHLNVQAGRFTPKAAA